MAAVDNSTWDGPAAMSRAAQSDDPAAAYAAIAAGRRAGDPELQSSWALPHHQNPGDPPNAAGVRNSLSRLPQTQGLTNHDAAQAHLEAHLAAINASAENPDAAELVAEEPLELQVAEHVTLEADSGVELVSVSPEKRRMGLKLLPYNTVAEHPRYGALMFEPGAFFTDPRTATVDPHQVRLRMDHADPPTGLGLSFTDKADAPYMEFQLSKTPRADEQLVLAKDNVSRGASVGFDEIVGRTSLRRIGGQNVKVYGPASARLNEVSTTWQPTFSEAGVTYMLSNEQEGNTPMTEGESVQAGIDYDKLTAAIMAAGAARQADQERDEKLERMLSAFDQMVEMQRAQFALPRGDAPKPKLYQWVEITLRRARGEAISPTLLRELALDDVITTEQPGLVPNVLVPDYDDLITAARPFLSSTRQIVAPATGTSLILPIITTRAVAGTQAGNAEKGALTTTATKVGTGTFAYKAVFGGADISIQMINRAESSFFDLLTGDLGEAYALDCEAKAITALLAGYTDSGSVTHAPDSGGVLDPEDPHFGDAWQTAITSGYKRAPDTIWMNAAAVGAFIDAKAPLTNAPLYSNLAAAFTAGGGPGGTISGLRPIYVPAMDSANVDVIVGPSRAFVWAEDPARTLQVDVPSVAGRDIALVGGIFPAPRYADAFTTYTIAS